jgi:type I restriction enzyme, S subunit
MTSRMSLFGTVPDDWELSRISEVATLKQGLQISKKLRSSVKEKGFIPLLKITDLPKKQFSEYVTDIKEQYIARKDDIIYTRTGQVGLVYTNVEGCVHNNCFKIIVDYNKINKDFMFYYLNNSVVREFSNSIASGSVQKDLTHSSFKTVPIAIPSYREQVKIGSLLRSLDEKIKTNNRIIKKLEEMAQVLLNHWFVNFEFPNENGEPYKSSGGEMVESELGLVPKGWNVGCLSDLIEIRYGKDHKKLKEGHIPVYGSGGVMRYVDTALYTSESVLVPRKGTLNNVMYINNPFWSVDTMFYSVMKKQDIAKYIYCFLKTKDLASMNMGSAVPSMTTAILNSMPIITKPLDLINRFNRILNPLFSHIGLLNEENDKLIQIRDTLLPRLMSGEVRIPLDDKDL